MKKVPVLVLTLCLLAILPATCPQEDGLPAGKELSILLSATVTDYQATLQDFFFQQRLLTASSLDLKLHLLETRTDELAGTAIQLDECRISLIQSLEDGNITAEQFAVEMHRLADEILILARSLHGLGQTISNIAMNVSAQQAFPIIEKFNAAARFLSEMGARMSLAMNQHGQSQKVQGNQEAKRKDQSQKVQGNQEAKRKDQSQKVQGNQEAKRKDQSQKVQGNQEAKRKDQESTKEKNPFSCNYRNYANSASSLPPGIFFS
ncbi:MAG: hypothetical protein HXS51_03650 [Theionarchaea archaeon]|nr:hypothetical protein [Theionarchaea archaeon]